MLSMPNADQIEDEINVPTALSVFRDKLQTTIIMTKYIGGRSDTQEGIQNTRDPCQLNLTTFCTAIYYIVVITEYGNSVLQHSVGLTVVCVIQLNYPKCAPIVFNIHVCNISPQKRQVPSQFVQITNCLQEDCQIHGT